MQGPETLSPVLALTLLLSLFREPLRASHPPPFSSSDVGAPTPPPPPTRRDAGRRRGRQDYPEVVDREFRVTASVDRG